MIIITILYIGNKTLVKLVVQGDKVTAKPTMKRPKIKQGLIPGEGKNRTILLIQLLLT